MFESDDQDIGGLGPPQPPAPSAIDFMMTDEPSSDPAITYGFLSAGPGLYSLPAGYICVEAIGDEAHRLQTDVLKTMGVPFGLGIWADERKQAFFGLSDPTVLATLKSRVPDGVTVISEGDLVSLSDFNPADHKAQSLAELTVLTADDVQRLSMPSARQAIRPLDPVITNALVPFSLRGQAGKFKRLAIEATPLLGEVCLKGQVTIWYAGPGTGKTLLALSLVVDAVREGRIAAENVFFVNADDNGSGFATKLQIMDDLGAHTLSPGFRNLRNSELVALLHKLADDDNARGVLVIVDTIKKFASLMDKKESSAIAQAFRQVAMKGGSVLGLAHTTKNANADGTARYAGTSDLVDDADAVFTITKLANSTEDKEKVVEFRRVKARGDSAERAAYAYAGEAGVPYDELLASVRLVDPQQIDEFKRVEEQRSDAELIAIATACIAEGFNTKMILAKEIASRANISGREGGRLIDRYTGADPSQHRWLFKRGGRGAFVYELLPILPPGDPAPA